MKKICALLISLFIFISNPIFYNQAVCADSYSTSDYEEQLEENIDEQLGNLDTSEIDHLFGDIMSSNQLFRSSSFSDKIKAIINGDLAIDANTFLSFIGNLFLEEILGFLPYISLIIAIAVLYSILSGIGGNKNKSVLDIVHFACFGAILVIIMAGVGNIIGIAKDSLSSIQSQMNLIFPILLTVLTGLGGSSSVTIFQPAMAILSSSVISIFTNILLPIFTFKLVFTVISNLTSNIKFNKFSEFFGSSFKWIIGIVLTIFSAVTSIQGLMAGSIDGVSIRTAKYTIKSSIPIIGGFLSDGVSLIMISGSLIKNAVGVGGLLLMFSTIMLPVIKILVFSFLMKLTAAILEPISDSRITSFVNDISKSIALIISLILGVAFMYFIIVGLVMCSTNIF